MKHILEERIDNFFKTEENILTANALHGILQEFMRKQKVLGEQSEVQKKLLKFSEDSINSLKKKDLNIISVTPSNKSDIAIVVRFEDKEDIEKARPKIRSAIEGNGISTKSEVISKYDSSIPVIVVYSGEDKIYIVCKYDIGSREGLALEHVVAFLLTNEITDQLKNRLDLPPGASNEQVLKKLKGDYADVLDVGLKGKKLLTNKLGEVLKAESVGSVNSKADLILTTKSGKKIGLSIKLVTEEGREIRFTYNKNLGYGDETDNNLVRNPSGKAWWIVGRKIFAKKLGRSYEPGADSFEPPSWMLKAKENKPDLYKEAMSEVYEKIRQVYISNLRRLPLKELIAIVKEAQQGDEEEQNLYDNMLVLISDVDGIRLEEKGLAKPDLKNMNGLDKMSRVKEDGAKIIIDIPGMSPLTIHGLKFHSNMLSSKRDDLKIKTR